ncbi:LacI family DNA-binding transcriptional regulator [Georgenia thermotolerans]|uniref:Substrate-binding domain-containing protein n=1 Tax=Georgenia thermotolerans TaxID=527326 RepID=A0A7J5UV28_9MICO|nr:LacI family DNA-binding transcriptional regulator [Georgenia thermotolerans]KAE8766126.1 substrate-binding domain-containing protein [Georgenia thermotolerans]
MARIVDVAARAGVSTATVSRVLNGKTVRADLAEAVRRAADELGYSPDRTARSLRRRHSDVIALVVADIENPFFTSLARGVEDVAREAGYSVVLCNSDDDPAKEARYLDIAERENMAGVIIAPADGEPPVSRLLARDRAVVVVDRPVAGAVDQVVFDNVTLARRATAALVERGHRRIACLAGPAATSTANDRAEGWRGALAEAGLDAPNELLVRTTFRVEGGRHAMGELLALGAPPDAVLATNNLVGVGALQALAERGRTDVQVAVIGDLPFLAAAPDSLVVVPLGARQMGMTAARMLVERIAGDDEPARLVVQRIDGVPGPEAGEVGLRQ